MALRTLAVDVRMLDCRGLAQVTSRFMRACTGSIVDFITLVQPTTLSDHAIIAQLDSPTDDMSVIEGHIFQEPVCVCNPAYAQASPMQSWLVT